MGIITEKSTDHLTEFLGHLGPILSLREAEKGKAAEWELSFAIFRAIAATNTLEDALRPYLPETFIWPHLLEGAVAHVNKLLVMEKGKNDSKGILSGDTDFKRLLSGEITEARKLMLIELSSQARTDIAFLVQLGNGKMDMFAIQVKNKGDPGLQDSLYSVTPSLSQKCQFLSSANIPAMVKDVNSCLRRIFLQWSL